MARFVPGGFEVHRNALGQVTQSIATVSGPDGAVATVTTNYDATTGQAIVGSTPEAIASTATVSGFNTITKVLLKDHLGSMVAEVTLVGTPSSPSVLATNGLVVHGFGPWGNARNAASPLNGDQRGFTGHEHLAELGIIHMNGRLYDAVIGRFLQADPIIQAPQNAQSHNRYSYVLNNPLSFTDPSGFSAWTQFRAPILAIAAALTMQYYLMPYLLGGTFGIACGSNGLMVLSSTGNAISAVASGFAAGGIAGGNIQSALQGALTAGVTFGLASGFDLHGAASFGEAKHIGQIALHSAMGCASAAMAGGSCKSGAIGGGVSAFASPILDGLKGPGKLIASALVGGIASRLSGGKFENGAMSAAFGYLFNEGVDRLRDGLSLSEQREAIARTAENLAGNKSWAVSNDLGESAPAGSNKCNIFVTMCVSAVTGEAPEYFRPSVRSFPGRVLPWVAGDWADRSLDPTGAKYGWAIVSAPGRGDIFAYRESYSNASGHVGIYLGDGWGAWANNTQVRVGYVPDVYKEYANRLVYRRWVGTD